MKILLVKLSSLGDVVHAMPAVQDIRAALPAAQIDWVVERAFMPLVQRCDGVGRVVACELRRWRHAPLAASTRGAWRAFRDELRSESYDAVIDLQGLTKSALVARTARLAAGGRRFALANQTDGSSYEAPTRWLADVAFEMAPRSHAVARSRELCARALGYQMPFSERFGLQARHPRAWAAIKKIANESFGNAAGAAAVPDGAAQPSNARAVVALVHGSSRADKCWPEAHWIALGRQLVAQGFALALAQGSDAENQRALRIAAGVNAGAVADVNAGTFTGALHAQVWPLLALDDLTDQLAACVGVIGVDSGLSHMAVALERPHVQIYNFDTAWRTGPQHRARQRSVYAQPTPTVAAVWQAWQQVMAAS